MKCPKCGNEHPTGSRSCDACEGNPGKTPSRQTSLLAVKILLVGGLTGLGTSLSFNLVHDAFTTDNMLDLWEFVTALTTPALSAGLVARATKSKIVLLMPIAYLTFLVPVLGASFGASGSEPLWQFAALGLVGGVVWSTPFGLWQLARQGNNTTTSKRG